MSQFNSDIMPECAGPSVTGWGRVPVSLEKMMKWYWMVRTWKVEVDLDLRYSYTGDPFWNPVTGAAAERVQAVGGAIFTGNNLPNTETDEKELVCQHSTIVQVSIPATQTIEGNVESVDFNFTIGLFNGDGETTPVWQLSEGLYYPSVFFDWAGVGANISATSRDSDEAAGIGVSIDEEEAFNMNQPNTGFPDPTGFLLQVGSIILTPRSYWPYAPSSGGAPIYSAQTGAQIGPNVVID